MSLIIVTGGTTGLANGTAVSQDGAQTHPLTFTSLNTPIDAHLRVTDDYYRADATFTLPAELEASFDGGSTWKGSALNPISYGADVADLNVAVKLRQIVSAGSTTGSLTTDGSDTAASALGQVTGLAAGARTSSGTVVPLTWTTVANCSLYRIDRSTDGGSTWMTGVLTSSVGSASDTGLTAGTSYTYRVVAIGTGRYKDGTASSSVTSTYVLGDVTSFAANISGSTIALSWAAVSGADHYLIEWGTDGSTYPNAIDSVSGTSYNHTGRSVDTVYYYRIVAHYAAHGGASANPALCGGAIEKAFTGHAGMELRSQNANFATARAGSGVSTQATNPPSEHGCVCQYDGTFYLDRVYMDFDTSAIPDAATIRAAVMRVTTTYVGFTSSGWSVVAGTFTNSPATTADWANLTLSDLGGPTANPTVNTPTDYPLSSAAGVNKTGYSRYGIIERGTDLANAGLTTAVRGNNVGGCSNATTAYRPVLKVSYTF